MDDGSELAGAIEFSDLDYFCRMCGFRRPAPKVRVVDISQVKAGWIAHGDIRRMRCRCARVYNQLVQYVPIECASFPCPSCGPGSKLTTEILSITETHRAVSGSLANRATPRPVGGTNSSPGTAAGHAARGSPGNGALVSIRTARADRCDRSGYQPSAAG